MNSIAHMIPYNIHVDGEDEYHLIIPMAGSDAGENKTAFAIYSFVSHFMIHTYEYMQSSTLMSTIVPPVCKRHVYPN